MIWERAESDNELFSNLIWSTKLSKCVAASARACTYPSVRVYSVRLSRPFCIFLKIAGALSKVFRHMSSKTSIGLGFFKLYISSFFESLSRMNEFCLFLVGLPAFSILPCSSSLNSSSSNFMSPWVLLNIFTKVYSNWESACWLFWFFIPELPNRGFIIESNPSSPNRS